MTNLIKSILRTAVYFLDQTDRVASNMRDRVSTTADRAADKLSDIRDQAHDLYEDDNNLLGNVLAFAAGVGVGVGVAVLFAPASGEEIRSSIGQKVQDIGGRVRNRFSSSSATGTEGM
jgi:gas vesicle protein